MTIRYYSKAFVTNIIEVDGSRKPGNHIEITLNHVKENLVLLHVCMYTFHPSDLLTEAIGINNTYFLS